MNNSSEKIQHYLLGLQQNICDQLEVEDDSVKFLIDDWQRNEGGGGSTRILNEGELFERAGVNYSHVYGNHLPVTATAQRPELSGYAFEAMGVSVVIHPKNPYVPTSHMNVRFFNAYQKDKPSIWWFGGGFDLTPYYPYEEDCIHWHQTAAKACEPFGANVYSEYKKNCDQYFYLKHRQETRGVGGLFFDDLNHWPFEQCFEFMQSIGDHYMKAYGPIVQKRKHQTYGDRERAFQCYRRGRYFEFNLLYDRGTLFGLQSGGRTESILMSLPPKVHWEYNYRDKHPDSPDIKLIQDYLKPREWLD